MKLLAFLSAVFILCCSLSCRHKKVSNTTNHPVEKMKILTMPTSASVALVRARKTGGESSNESLQQMPVMRFVCELAPSHQPDDKHNDFSFSIFEDSITRQKAFVEGTHDFYVPTDKGFTGFTVGPGVLVWRDEALRTQGPADTSAAVEYFEANLDVSKFVEATETAIEDNRIQLSSALPRFFFSDYDGPGNMLVQTIVESASFENGQLHLVIRNPQRNLTAAMMIALSAKKVIESSVNGQKVVLDRNDDH